ncbi:metallophosphoesterase [Corallococcus exiguus]|uniref:metallophosphoesterase n=1 Tax=Corallococcus exiguus TaxID=83462 RepID=UPI0015611E10|nr:metallophosphoesterase [Corallococcus exiguus]NRD55150.1 metallophosphoesterase [Corallococcus exiguus]
MKPLAIIGDVHGNTLHLKKLLASPEITNRPIIFTGDIIGRGPNSKQAIQLILERATSGLETITVLGHHEVYFLEYIKTGNFIEFAARGGVATLSSYLGLATDNVHEQLLSRIPREHLDFLERARPFWENEHVLVSHTGVPLDNQSSRTIEDMVLRSHLELFSNRPNTDKLVVCGHYTQRNNRPFVSGNFVCIDTGSGLADGSLTALLLPEMQFIQT